MSNLTFRNVLHLRYTFAAEVPLSSFDSLSDAASGSLSVSVGSLQRTKCP